MFWRQTSVTSYSTLICLPKEPDLPAQKPNLSGPKTQFVCQKPIFLPKKLICLAQKPERSDDGEEGNVEMWTLACPVRSHGILPVLFIHLLFDVHGDSVYGGDHICHHRICHHIRHHHRHSC